MKVCKYCGKKFEREHLHARHERVQCKKRLPSKPPEHSKHIELARKLVEQNRSEVEGEMTEIQKRNIEEAESLHRNVILLKNTKHCYEFKCKHCGEGFEYERECVEHEVTCIYSSNTSTEKGELERLREEVMLQRREMKHLQDKVTQLRDKVELVEQVEQQLRDLKEIEFHLALFKNATLKGTT
jgi:hypothetical protein